MHEWKRIIPQRKLSSRCHCANVNWNVNNIHPHLRSSYFRYKRRFRIAITASSAADANVMLANDQSICVPSRSLRDAAIPFLRAAEEARKYIPAPIVWVTVSTVLWKWKINEHNPQRAKCIRRRRWAERKGEYEIWEKTNVSESAENDSTSVEGRRSRKRIALAESTISVPQCSLADSRGPWQSKPAEFILPGSDKEKI